MKKLLLILITLFIPIYASALVELSNNNNLENLSVYGYPLGFSSEVLEYNISIGTEAKLNITYTTENEDAEVYIEGNENLVKGSIIKVKVIAQAGDVREYKINIKDAEPREEIETNEEESFDMNLIIYGGIIALVTLFLIVINIKGKKAKTIK